MKIINGDPLTFENSENRIYLHWGDCIRNDHVHPYRDHAPENQHMNEDLGWEEHLEPVDSEYGGLTVRWWEYRGKSCREGVPMPMLLCFHTYYATCWQRIADREGMVLVAFEYHRNLRAEKGSGGFGPKDDEIGTYHSVSEMVIEKYGCDRSRLFITGQSYGDMCALRYVRMYGGELAAAAFTNGPTCPYNLKSIAKNDGRTLPALPVFQLRSERDFSCDGFVCDIGGDGHGMELDGNFGWIQNTRSHSVVINRDQWFEPDGITDRRPVLSSRGERVFASYRGENGELIYCEAANRCHAPAIDTAEVLWETLFSRCSRVNGRVNIAPATLAPDKGFALVAGLSRAYIDSRVTELPAKCVILSPAPNMPVPYMSYCRPESEYESFYAPLALLTAGFGAENLTVEKAAVQTFAWPGAAPAGLGDEDVIIRFERCGKRYELWSNTCVAVVDGRVLDLHRPPLTINGGLMLPVKELATLFGLFVSERNDAIYVTDHPMQLGFTVSRLLREEILSDEIKPRTAKVTLLPTEGGAAALSGKLLPEGETLSVTLSPAPGYRVEGVTAYMNGFAVPVTKVDEEHYEVFNVLCDTAIEARFVPVCDGRQTERQL